MNTLDRPHRARRLVALAVVLACTATLTVTLQHRPAEAWLTYTSGRETHVFLTPWETQYLAKNLGKPGSLKVCSVPGGGLISRVVKAMNRLCGSYKARDQILYWRVKWMLQNAAWNGGCGSFIIHDGRLGTSFRTPQVWGRSGWTTHAWTSPNQVHHFKTPGGHVARRCSEYAVPSRQSPLRPPGGMPHGRGAR